MNAATRQVGALAEASGLTVRTLPVLTDYLDLAPCTVAPFRIAVASTLPALLAVVACGVLAATGALVWQVPCAGPVALVFQGMLTAVRLRRGPVGDAS
ncbi:hypothetical protein [Streptomyces sp. NPDC048516]|uniref:hypothetical protein n=1 Tax=Streptomyces sp. NPDC048516 TaxID=3365565 RepID=UPI00371BED18